jgi:hypothetical protein
MSSNSDNTKEQPPPATRSSWSAAISQLPGFPRPEERRLLQTEEPVRTVSPMKSGDES